MLPMIRLVVLLALWTVLGVLGAWLADSGTVHLQWRDWQADIHAGLLVGALLLLVAAAIALFEAWRWLFGLPGRSRERRRTRRRIEGYEAMASGMVAAAAGDAVAASMYGKTASRLLADEPAILLLSAQTAQLEGKDDVAKLRFKEMLEQPETRFLGMRGLLADAIQRGAWDEALDLAREAYRLRPNTPWVLTTLFDLLTRAELWTEALEITTQLGRERLFHKDEIARRRGLLHHMLAEDAVEADDPESAFTYARQAVKLVPGFTPAIVLAASIAHRLGRRNQARRMLEQA